MPRTSPAVYINDAPVLTPEQLLSGLCKLGHNVTEANELVRRSNGIKLVFFCRRCVTEMTCGKGLHDLTNPENATARGRCIPCRQVARAKYWEETGSAKQRAIRAERKEAGVQRPADPNRKSYMRDGGWPPLDVLDADLPCGTATATLFDPYEPRHGETPAMFRARLVQAQALCARCPVLQQCDEWAADRFHVARELRIAGGRYHGALPGRQPRPLEQLPEPTPPKQFAVRLTGADVRRGVCPHGHNITRHGTGSIRVGRSNWCRACRPDLVRVMEPSGPTVPSVPTLSA